MGRLCGERKAICSMTTFLKRSGAALLSLVLLCVLAMGAGAASSQTVGVKFWKERSDKESMANCGTSRSRRDDWATFSAKRAFIQPQCSRLNFAQPTENSTGPASTLPPMPSVIRCQTDSWAVSPSVTIWSPLSVLPKCPTTRNLSVCTSTRILSTVTLQPETGYCYSALGQAHKRVQC